MSGALTGDVPECRRLLELGANRNAKNSKGKRALDIALSEGHREVTGIMTCGNEALTLSTTGCQTA